MLRVIPEEKKKEVKPSVTIMGIDIEKFVREVVAELSTQKGLINEFRENLQYKINLINERINGIEDRKRFVRVEREDLIWLFNHSIVNMNESPKREELKKKYMEDK